MGHLGLPDLGKATAAARAECYPFLPLCAVLSFVHTMGWLPVSGMFNPCSDVDACSCVQDLCEHHQRVCTDGWLGEKSLVAPGNKTCQLCTRLLSPCINQLRSPAGWQVIIIVNTENTNRYYKHSPGILGNLYYTVGGVGFFCHCT